MPFITQILLPKRDNQGRSFGRKRYEAFHARMVRRFGGWTRKGHAEGAWLSSSGKLHVEEHWVYEVGDFAAQPALLASGKGAAESRARPRRHLDHPIRGPPSVTSYIRNAVARSFPSALITDKGRRVLLRLDGKFYELSQEDLRTLLGLAPGPPGLGITVEHDRLCFEFAADNKTFELSVSQLKRLLAKDTARKRSTVRAGN
jgi:hypothetical protein